MRPVLSLARSGLAPPSAVGDGGGSNSSKKKDGGGSTNKNLPRLHRLPSPSSPSRASATNRSRAAGLTASPEPSKEARASNSAQQQQPAAPASSSSGAAAASASRSAAALAYAQGLFSRFRGNESVSREGRKERSKKTLARSRLLGAIVCSLCCAAANSGSCSPPSRGGAGRGTC